MDDYQLKVMAKVTICYISRVSQMIPNLTIKESNCPSL